ncbi:MAG: tripartite tricarboxylate transporter substrate binding protein [Burkholderiaceae bacterium]
MANPRPENPAASEIISSARRRFAVSMLALASTPILAQSGYPDRPVKVIVPFPAGGQTDIVARLFAQKASPLLGQSIVVENRPGANTVIGSEAVAKSAPDGYTLLFNQSALVTNQVIMPRIPYDPFTDFAPVYRAYESAAVWAAPPDSAATLEEFASRARAAKKEITFGTAGHGSTSHFFGQMLSQAIDVPFTHVPYKGEPPVIPDLTAGRLDAGVVSTASAVQYGGDGRIRALAVSGKQRMAALPDLPTFEEQGVKGLAAEAFVGFFAPVRTPPEIILRLHDAFARVSRMDGVNDKLLANGLEVAPVISPREFQEKMVLCKAQWAEIKRKTGIVIE